MPKNWNRRFKYTTRGTPRRETSSSWPRFRNLAIREWEKGLSLGRRGCAPEGEEDPRLGVHVRAGEGREGPRPTSTSSWRSASAQPPLPDGPRHPRSLRPPAPGTPRAGGRRPWSRSPGGRWSPGRSRPGPPPAASARSSSRRRRDWRGRSGRPPLTRPALIRDPTRSKRRRRCCRGRGDAGGVGGAGARAGGLRAVVVHDAARPLEPPPSSISVLRRLMARPDADGVIAAAPIAPTP